MIIRIKKKRLYLSTMQLRVPIMIYIPRNSTSYKLTSLLKYVNVLDGLDVLFNINNFYFTK